jgi:predicted CXXCH cytochrome family protein
MISSMKKSGYYKKFSSFGVIVGSLVYFLLVCTAGAEGPVTDECIKCHEKVYLKAISYSYQHSILREACTHCHVKITNQGETYATLNFSTFQKEQFVHIKDIDEERRYEAEVIITDERGTKGLPKRVKTHLTNPSEQSIQFADIKTISDVSVDEVKKGGFVRAVLSWDTNAYSTSEVEYWTDNSRKSRFSSGSIFAKRHSVILNRLRHSTLYTFKVISRDTYGNLLESSEYSIDTSNNFIKPGNTSYNPPVITHLDTLTIEGERGVFLKVFSNKASQLKIKLIEIKDMDLKHGFGLLDPMVVRIDTCTKCHPRGTSHPVGVKAEGRKIRNPKELPTIDGHITCVTCHSPHGGNNAFFARYDRNRDICILCHIGGY